MKEYTPIWDRKNETWFIKEKLPNNQTMIMSFERTDSSADTDYWNIALCVVNKRKHINRVFDNVEMTGKNPIQTVHVARGMFKQLENTIMKDDYQRKFNNIIYCSWLDKQRREVYYKYLSRRGYSYGMLWGSKVIMKYIPKKDG